MHTNTEQLHTSNFPDMAKNVGLVLMTVAATIGMVELPEHHNSKVTVNAQPVYSFANNLNTVAENTLRRERDDTAPHFISYSAFQRTPGRTGKY